MSKVASESQAFGRDEFNNFNGQGVTFRTSSDIASKMINANKDLYAALDALTYLIEQIREIHEPTTGIHECFAQAFGSVQMALFRREVLESLHMPAAGKCANGLGGNFAQRSDLSSRPAVSR
ncbi:hypothetical protein GO001_34910 [Streptomyces sp. NRRL B-1677]|uniref:hypothetical protein n=1 Tax=Streptomyces TaxID=1883 RepID=UPI0011C3F386|nr:MULTISPECIES: hypothetical protein [Streptomyces]MBF6050298.1 hypothetical protein [Streptomyces sp. NRRL B-1677]